MGFRAPAKSGKILLLVILLVTLVFHSIPIRPVRTSPATIRVPENFQKIQDAVDAASPGDNILVSSGVYNENLKIAKSLNLTGASKETTIIDAQFSGPGVNITAASLVSISGFTVRNTGFFDDGIVISSSFNIVVQRNNVQSSSQTSGAYIHDSNAVRLRENSFAGNLYGVRIQGGAANIIQKNNVTDNVSGIVVYSSQGNEIKYNWVARGESGLDFQLSSENVVARNIVANFTGEGISFQDSKDNLIVENNVEFNRAFSNTIGIRLQYSTGNRLYYNNIRNNTIQVFGVSPSGEDITLNIWNDGSPSPRGNYWSDYSGLDDGSSLRVAGDGVGDTEIPHPCPNGGRPCSVSGPSGVDSNPLMSPWQPPSLSVNALVDRNVGYPLVLISFTGTAVGGSPPYIFTWNFGDGASGTQQNITHTYLRKGSYIVTLTALDSLGTTRSESLAITMLTLVGDLVLRVLNDQQEPIAGADISSLSQPASQTALSKKTSIQGIADFQELTPGPYLIQASSAGYETVRKDVTVVANQTVEEPLVLARVRLPDYTFIVLGVGGVGAAVAGAFFYLQRRSRAGVVQPQARY